MFEIILVVSRTREKAENVHVILCRRRSNNAQKQIAICNRVTQVGDLQMGFVYKHT